MRKKRRRPFEDLQEKLSRCEQLLEQYTSAEAQGQLHPSSVQEDQTPSSSTTDWSQTQSNTSAPHRPLPERAHNPSQLSGLPPVKDTPKAKLINEDGRVRFTDSFLLGTIFDELKSMRNILDEEEPPSDVDDDGSDDLAPDANADLILGLNSPSLSLEDLHPQPNQIFRLWQIYLERIDPLTKLIHVPSVQPYLADACGGSVPRKIAPLLFAIYTLAVVTMSPAECDDVLGCPRHEALRRFSLGVRIALSRVGFMKNADMLTLQALVMYTVCTIYPLYV